jgi:thiol:disulfide interchange protein DsbD
MLSRVPRAGRWSDLLKQGLGIVMIGVAVYLLTLISNATLWPWVLAGGVVVALVCWAWGQIPTFNMERGRIWGIRVCAVALGAIMGVALYMLGARFSVMGQVQRGEENGWKPFNIALLDDALAHHRPVVVDWTASWCINCHFLEAAVLDTDPVEKAFQDGDALLLRADLSSDNPPATLLNHELGGEAIPVLAIFSPSRPLEPVVLRDIYSKDELIGEVRKAQ